MAANRPRKQDIEYQSHVEFHKTLRAAVKGITIIGTVGLVGLFMWLTVRDLAGRATLADITFRVLADLKANKPISMMIAYLFGFAGLGYGGLQHHLRRRYVERFSPFLQAREKEIDPQRTSSSITMTGDTRPEDRW